MYPRLLNWLRCPVCGGTLQVGPNAAEAPDTELEDGTLFCAHGHIYSVEGGIPRMLPDRRSAGDEGLKHADRTQESFSRQWEYHDQGDRTWGLQLDDRLQTYLLEPLRLSQGELQAAVLLDAGCGNGSLSAAITEVGPEVIGLDLSSGLELGQEFRHQRQGVRPDRVHFVQGDLLEPPLAPGSLDIIYSSGVLHHTPEPQLTFATLRKLLRPGGSFYLWVYRRQPLVTPVISTIRYATTRVSPARFGAMANRAAPAVLAACRALNAVGIPKYVRTRRETAFALMDVFGTPHVHYQTPRQVRRWFTTEGFEDVWLTNENRRGFGMCGRLPQATGRV